MYSSSLVKSRLGELNVTATDGAHVHVSAGSQHDGEASDPLKLRGVPYRVSAHYWCDASGAWSTANPDNGGTPTRLFITRDDCLQDPSFPARRDIARAILETLTGFMREKCGRDLLASAGLEAAERALDDAAEKVREAEEALSAARSVHADARIRLARLTR